MRCGSCGWDSPTGVVFCTNCGKRLADQAEPASAPVATPSPLGRVGLVERQLTQGLGGKPSRPPVAARANSVKPAAMPAPSLHSPTAPATSEPREPERPIYRQLDVIECGACHAPSARGQKFCSECGARFGLDEASVATPQESAPGRGPVGLPQRTMLAAVRPARLVTLLKDGSEGQIIELGEQDADIGGSEGDVKFPDDPYLSPRHARLSLRSGAYLLRDLESVNGVYVRLREDAELVDQDTLLVGQQVLRFELLRDGELPLGPAFQRGVMVFGTPESPRFARLVQYTTEGLGRDVHYLFRDETVLGRENGDIVFTDDPFLSRRHAAIRVDQATRRFTVRDLGSSNGTALRLRGEHVLKDGDQFRIGRHLFRFEGNGAGSRGGR